MLLMGGLKLFDNGDQVANFADCQSLIKYNITSFKYLDIKLFVVASQGYQDITSYKAMISLFWDKQRKVVSLLSGVCQGHDWLFMVCCYRPL